ncbi:MAG: chondroitinase family polysaccharide lyase, partial [Bacteroidaceae bacterium]
MKKGLLIGLLITFGASSFAYNFEENTVPNTINANGTSISSEHFKDGKQSLKWEWNISGAILTMTDADIKNVASFFSKRSGIKFWIYNETPFAAPLVFNFKDEQKKVQYTFNFNMNFKGWRAGWIAYSDMWTPNGEKTILKYVASLDINAPKNINTGKIWIDRVEFSTSVDRQATPDAQIPDNNRHLGRDIWHWGLLQKWEQTAYDTEIPSTVTAQELADMNTVSEKIKNEVKGKALTSAENTTLTNLANNVLKLTADGKGAPLMQKDNCASGDVNFSKLNTLLNLSARGWYIDNDVTKKNIFIQGIRYMLDQGFAYGSCMGTNHHYGYEIRELFGAVWWMKDVLKENGLWDDTYKAIAYWSGLQESRQPHDKLRDEIADSWNTLTIPRLSCAMMIDNNNERLRALRSLSRWVNGSICITPGTIGGIKIDGTAFHHGGHYPGYAIPGYGSLGKYLNCVNGTSFGLNAEAFSVFKFAMESACKYTNLRDWGFGICGRNPFTGSMSTATVNTYAFLAKAVDPIDKDLAADFLRVREGIKSYTMDKALVEEFTNQGITAAKAPQGFFVYNYTCLGVFRYNEQMINLKGFSKNLWGSEIYTKNNRYGRYQSYGSIQIIGTKSPTAIEGGHPITEADSRFIEEGWDWNRVPGTTTIHLPFDKLNSPIATDDMVRQNENFSGASSLMSKYGLFATKLSEFNRTNFTGSFQAHKSAFCVGNKIICLGTNIDNGNNSYPTETTLFQQSLLSPDEALIINNETITAFPLDRTEGSNGNTVLKDLTGNYYFIPQGQNLKIIKSLQASKKNTNKTDTQGNYATVYLNHGNAPKSKDYEYMISLEPSNEEVNSLIAGTKG